MRLKEGDLQHYFTPGVNIGVLTGEPSGGLVDVDLDAAETVAIAADLLPKTSLIHGRRTKPDSHYWYCSNPPPDYAKFDDTDGSCLVEIRSDGHQTVLPPSKHPTGEIVEWSLHGEPGKVCGEELQCHVGRLAAAAILARHWPEKGSRNEAALALAGGLMRSGWEQAEAEHFICCAARAAGDEEWRIRLETVERSAKRLEHGGDATGWPRLEAIMGRAVVEKVCRWLGFDSESAEIVDMPPERHPLPEPLGTDAYHGVVGEMVRKIEPESEAHPAALLVQALVAFGNLLGRNAYCMVGADRHYCNLFAVIVGISSKGRKGASLAQVRRIIRSIEGEWEKQLPSGLSSGEGLIWAVRDPISKIQPIRKDGKVVDYEEVIQDRGITDKRLLVIEAEFVSVLDVMSREGNTLSALIRQAWDTGSLRALTKNIIAQSTNAHVSIIAQ